MGKSGTLQAVDVRLFGDDREPFTTVQPDAMGRFVFDNVGLGEWRIEASHPAYSSRNVWTFMTPDAQVAVGDVVLEHVSTTTDAVRLSGRIHLAHRLSHGGTGVGIRAEPEGLLIAAVQTQDNGDFSTLVAPQEKYSLSVQRPGYVVPDTWGPFEYDAVDGRFEDSQGRPIERTLEALHRSVLVLSESRQNPKCMDSRVRTTG